MSLCIDSLSHEDASKYLHQCNIDTEKPKEILAKYPARILDLKIMCRAHWERKGVDGKLICVGMVQAASKPQPGRNFPDFKSVRTVQKVVEAVVEVCECWSGHFGSWSGHLMMRLSESALF
jgi:hypothetical protein